MDTLTLSQKIMIWAIPTLFAITLHEVAHGWVASLCGDSTAKMLGRLTANPLKHIDPVGTIIVPGLMLLLSSGGLVFGWAKPVPVNSRNLHHPRRDMILVAAAGPVSNLLMAAFWALFTKLCIAFLGSNPIYFMGLAGILINLTLCVFNLIPIPPLDGSSVLAGLLPPRMAYYYLQIAPFGFFILLALFLTGMISPLLYPPITGLYHLFLSLVGLS